MLYDVTIGLRKQRYATAIHSHKQANSAELGTMNHAAGKQNIFEHHPCERYLALAHAEPRGEMSIDHDRDTLLVRCMKVEHHSRIRVIYR